MADNISNTIEELYSQLVEAIFDEIHKGNNHVLIQLPSQVGRSRLKNLLVESFVNTSAPIPVTIIFRMEKLKEQYRQNFPSENSYIHYLTYTELLKETNAPVLPNDGVIIVDADEFGIFARRDLADILRSFKGITIAFNRKTQKVAK